MKQKSNSNADKRNNPQFYRKRKNPITKTSSKLPIFNVIPHELKI